MTYTHLRIENVHGRRFFSKVSRYRSLQIRHWQWRAMLIDPVQRELGTELNAWNVILNLMIGILAAVVLLGAIGCLMVPS
ncbi:hypothetical protein FE249_00900 [Acidiphilium multivorum]|uniref:hypothetical protein n=1 Tax=Acidiphilium multivorum TaxID=62140 RepID=UPI001F4C33B6|nr:hypothetical protein [Acidiphilium multivorum]UNC12885.1 hypothetical protein FE249_00900 [Acidiphilium multivorum]